MLPASGALTIPFQAPPVPVAQLTRHLVLQGLALDAHGEVTLTSPSWLAVLHSQF